MRHVSTQRERDKAVILNVVRSFGPLSRVRIHHLTQLGPSVVSRLTGELLESGDIVVTGRSDNPTGRKQILLKVNESSGFVVGLEFDSQVIVASVMDLGPGIRSFIKQRTDLSGGVDGLIGQLAACVRAAMAEAGVPARHIRGIGIGDVGIVNRRTGVSVMASQIDFWRNVPLAERFQKEFGVPVLVDNATRCRGNAERLLGAGESRDDMIYLEYGAGIGAAIFSGGRVLDGHRTSAGEFGHTRVSSSGPPCTCGSFGCLEALAATGALASRFRDTVARSGISAATTVGISDVESADGWAVLRAAQLGNKICTLIVDDMRAHLALGLGNLINILDPEAIVLDQRLEICGTEFLGQLHRDIRLQALGHMTSDLVLSYGSLGEQAGVLGAGLLVIEQMFGIPELKPARFLLEPHIVSAQVLPD